MLLPSGGGLIKVADQMDFDRNAIYGRVAGRGDWTRLSPLHFCTLFPLNIARHLHNGTLD